MTNPDITEAFENVLVAHQRMDIRSCLCGWDELGRSHAKHVASVLRRALAELVPLREVKELVNPSWEEMRQQARDIGFNEAHQLFLGDEE